MHARSLALFAATLAATPVAADETALAAGRALSADFLAGKTDGIFARMTPEMQRVVGGAPQLAQFRAGFLAQAGEEQVVVAETTDAQGEYRIYARDGRYAKAPVPFRMQWTLDAAGRIAGFFVRPAPVEASSPHAAREPKAHLQLPFDGEWYVFWGGRTLADNYHAQARDQRYAYDLVVMRDGKSHAGAGSRNEDYFCFGRPILAPAAGRVVAAEDGRADQAPGRMDETAPFGNHVILDLGHGEYAFFAHLKQGSVAVKPGAAVAVGAALGVCGNSGRSSEPHLHFHLQDSPTPFQGDGLPVAFFDYLANGAPIARGEPKRGERIAPAR